MKKLVTLFTLAIAMVASADVASQNIVGYQTQTLPAGGQILVAASFAKVGGGSMSFAEFCGNTTFSDGDLLYVWDGTGYGAGYTWDGGENAWWDLAADDVGSPTIAPGTGFWLISAGGATTFSMAGQVLDNDVTLQFDAGQSLTASPFPAGLELNGSKTVWTGTGDGDLIYVWDGSSYGAGYTWDGGENAWWDLAADDVASGVNVPSGSGFWIINANPVTLNVQY